MEKGENKTKSGEREDEMREDREKGRLRYERKDCVEREMWVRKEK